MILFNRKIENNGPPLVILHGLFGSGDNWQTHAKNWSAQFEIYLIDQRNHGHSAHSSEMNYESMAHDLKETLDYLNLQNVNLIGHSMGGKAVMRFSQLYPEYVNKLIVVDMGVKEYPPHHDLIFQGLESVDVENCPSRKEAEIRLSHYISDNSTKQFLLKNLYWIEEGRLAWRFFLMGLKNNIHHILEPLPSSRCFVPSLFLFGGKSNYVLTQDFDQILAIFPHAHFHELENAGHWVHAEDPENFSKTTLNFLLNTEE
jgi:pimeloyl-ACP methyl ester carboxylesterase